MDHIHADAHGGQKRELEPLELEIRGGGRVVSHHIGTRNQTWVSGIAKSTHNF